MAFRGRRISKRLTRKVCVCAYLVVWLPHMGSATLEGRIEMGEKVILNIKIFADGHRPPDLVVPGML